MKNFFLKIKTYVFAHKIISIIFLVVILFASNWVYGKITSKKGETRYVTSKVTKGTIISSITGSGQVSASSQIDIKPEVSGTITYVNVQPGDKVGSGKLLFSIDNTSAQKAVRDAEMNLQSAQIALDKLKIQNSNTNTNADTIKVYDNAFNTTSNVYLDLPSIMTGLNDMFFKTSTMSTSGQLGIDWYEGQVSRDDIDNVKPYKQNFLDSYKVALTSYNSSFSNYQTISRSSDNITIEKLISQTYDSLKLISDAIKNANNYIDFVNTTIQKYNNRTSPAIISTNKTTLSDYTSKINTALQNLLSSETDIQNNKDSFSNNDLDTQSQQLSLTQKQNALQDAKDNLANYYVYAPFSGTIASVPVQKGDNASSGTILATIITTQQIATIALNEVDIAKIQLGQKVTLTFDAVSDLTIAGKVAQIDSIGTVSQGVVNYNVKIKFDTTDERIKPGMTANASIITNVRQDVLMVPNSSVKTQNGTSYVQMFDAPLATPLTGIQGSPSLTPPINQTVVVGISNDTSTEITSGLNEGDIIVTKTVTSTNTTTTATPSILGAGANRGAGGMRLP